MQTTNASDADIWCQIFKWSGRPAAQTLEELPPPSFKRWWHEIYSTRLDSTRLGPTADIRSRKYEAHTNKRAGEAGQSRQPDGQTVQTVWQERRALSQEVSCRRGRERRRGRGRGRHTSIRKPKKYKKENEAKILRKPISTDDDSDRQSVD